MPKKYIVGLDAGHGETAAWIVPIHPNKEMGEDGDSARLNASNNTDERARHSVIYLGADGVYDLYNSKDKAIITKMKMPVSKMQLNPEKQRAYRQYIRLVVQELVKLNPILTLSDQADGKPNFHICMASPTKWNDRDKDEYLKFFNEAVADLGISFDWIINESDAAYFSFHKQVQPSDVVLIIDYGSSTIDYTVMYNGKKISKDEWSNPQLGSGNIEDAIVDSYRTQYYEDFQRCYGGSEQLLIANDIKHIDILELLNYKCRILKETHYKSGTPDAMSLEYHLGDKVPELKLQFRKYRFEYDFCLSEAIEGYVGAVRVDFEDLKSKIEKASGKNVTKVILSGGACIMHWVAPMVKEIFPKASIIDDRHPSFVVAKGIARYALAQMRALDQIRSEITAVDYKKAYTAADLQATKDAIKDLSGSTISAIRNLTTCIKMVDRFNEYIASLDDSNYQYLSLVKNKISSSVTGVVRAAMDKAFKAHFNWNLDTSAININVDAQCVPWNPSNFTYEVRGQEVNTDNTGAWSAAVMVAINNILERRKSFFTGTNWTKDRDSEDRNAIADNLVNEVLKSEVLDGFTYPEEILRQQEEKIKAQAMKYAEDIFYQNQLFRTTFS